jgi:hypothetical protein
MARRVNKTQAVKDYYKAHPQASNQEVIAALAKDSISVTTNYVSSIKSLGKKKGKKSAKKAIAATAPTTNGGLNLAQVKAAFRFIKECGDVGAAKAALSAADELKKLVV